jgi:hypothetical protein
MILKDAGREILTDDDGREYYVGWRYSPTNNPPVYCQPEGNCEIVDGMIADHFRWGHGFREFVKNTSTSV